MSSKKNQMCPLFPDMECPQGKEAAAQCQVRINGDYDPVRDFKDLLMMHCAIYRAEQSNKQEKTK